MEKLWKTIKELFPLDTDLQFKVLGLATVYLCEGIEPTKESLKTVKINWKLIKKAITKPKKQKQTGQLEFCFESENEALSCIIYSSPEIKKYKKDNYRDIYEILLQRTLSLDELVALSKTTKKTVSKVITKMSLIYPLYSPKRGMYAVLPPLKKSLAEIL